LVFIVLSSVTEITAWWLLASPDRNQPELDGRRSSAVARAITSALMALIVASGAYGLLSTTSPVAFGLLVLLWPPLCSLIGGLMANFAGELMKRSRHRRLHRVFRLLSGVFAFGVVAPLLLGILLMWIAPYLSVDAARWIIGVGTIIVTIGVGMAWLAAARRVWADRRAAMAAWVSD
ncbi:MAG: hypothetical protein JWM57_3312, partial [Phycisphaerales bacterium]|nr:hypothetical protein [Phycisphaerales bacterium]